MTLSIRALKQSNLEKIIVYSTSSGHDASSKYSTKPTSSLLVRKQAQVQAAIAIVVYAEQEAVIKRQKAELAVIAAATSRNIANRDIELLLLQDKNEAAIVEVESETLQQSQAGTERSSAHLPMLDLQVRTAEYIIFSINTGNNLNPTVPSFEPSLTDAIHTHQTIDPILAKPSVIPTVQVASDL